MEGEFQHFKVLISGKDAFIMPEWAQAELSITLSWMCLQSWEGPSLGLSTLCFCSAVLLH